MQERYQNLAENAEAEEKQERRKHPEVASFQSRVSDRTIGYGSFYHADSQNIPW